MRHVTVFWCSEHGEVELQDYGEEIAYCGECNKQMTKIAEFDEDQNGAVKNLQDGTGRKATTQVKVFECSEHKEVELVDFNFDRAFCPCCGKEMKKVGEYME